MIEAFRVEVDQTSRNVGGGGGVRLRSLILDKCIRQNSNRFLFSVLCSVETKCLDCAFCSTHITANN